MARPALALRATAQTSVPCRQGASVAHAGCGPGLSGLLVRPMAPPSQGKSQKAFSALSESGKLRIRGNRNWVRLNAADRAGMVSLIPAGWGPKKDCLQAWAKVTLHQKELNVIELLNQRQLLRVLRARRPRPRD